MMRFRSPRADARRACNRSLLLSSALVASAIAAAPATAAVPVLPDLQPVAPTAGANNWYLDLTSNPGKVQLRFPSGVTSVGGIFDIQGAVLTSPPGATPATWSVNQIIHNADASTTSNLLGNVGMSGTPGPTQTTWSASNLATYTLTPKAGQSSSATLPASPAKICLSDGTVTFKCQRANGVTPEMGLGAGKTDDSTASDGIHFSAFFDVTGKAGLLYTFAAKVNPKGDIQESNTANDTASLPANGIEIPQALITSASDALSATGSQPADLALSAHPTAQQIAGGAPAGKGGLIANDANSTFQLLSSPLHGTVTITGSTATYTADAGYAGPDSFSYRATDVRGLVSIPRSVSVTVNPGPPPSVLPITPVTMSTPTPVLTSAPIVPIAVAPRLARLQARCLQGAASRTKARAALSHGCKLRLRFSLSERASVTISLLRGRHGKVLARSAVLGRAGANRLIAPARILRGLRKPGVYTIVLRTRIGSLFGTVFRTRIVIR